MALASVIRPNARYTRLSLFETRQHRKSKEGIESIHLVHVGRKMLLPSLCPSHIR